MNNAELKEYFRVYNERYFDDKLNSNTKTTFGKTKKRIDGYCHLSENRIVINENLRQHDVLTLICLLHEMAHIKLGSTYVGGIFFEDADHGMLYQAELVRLIHAGAYDGLL